MDILNNYNRMLRNSMFREPTPQENGNRIKEQRLYVKANRRLLRLARRDKLWVVSCKLNTFIRWINARVLVFGMRVQCPDCDTEFHPKFFWMPHLQNEAFYGSSEIFRQIAKRIIAKYPAEPVEYVPDILSLV